MKVRLINKTGYAWDFDSVKEARKYIKTDGYYTTVIENDKKIRVYDDRCYTC
jgi:hypothetical protein